MPASRVLITGGSGFLGANLARAELAAGNEVHLLLRAQSDLWRLADLHGLYHTQPGDVSDADAVRRAVEQSRPEVIYHLAAYGVFPGQRDRGTTVDVNIRGTQHLLDALAGRDYQALVHAGSSSEYGHKDRPMRPDDVLQPRNDYGVTKAAATLLCQAAALGGAPVCTVRVFSAYGPWEDPTRLASDVMARCRRGEPPKITSGQQPRDWIYVEDVIALLRFAARTPEARGKILHAGTGKSQTVRDLVETILRVATAGQLAARYGSLPPRPDEPTCWVADIRETVALTGWHPTWSREAGIRAQWDWFVQRQQRLAA